MHLSIFNFNSFIWKSIAAALGLTLLYVVVISLTQPKITFTQNQYQANIIFAQDFIYRHPKPSRVIVGSSMATRMKFDKEDNVYNLAFGGGGPLTGLEIIRKSGYVPEAIFIESNIFTMPADRKFLDALFVPVLFELRGKIIALQEKYQILNLAGTFIYSFAGRSQGEKLHRKVDKKLLDRLVKNALKNADKVMIGEKDLLLKQWHKEMSYFQKKGTKIVFFEMPNDPRLAQTPGREQVRTLIRKEFLSVPYIKENNTNNHFKTGDGIHLTLKSAIAFSRHFKEKVLQQ